MFNNNDFQIQKNIVLSGYNKNNVIGTLKEKTLHKIIKLFIENDETFHEIKIGSYYADVFVNNNIYEIQTKSFNKLRSKLAYFLTNYTTYIVYPIFYKKWVCWFSEEKNEVIEKRKSPKTGTIYDIILELYKIKSFLNNKNINILLLFFNANEYKSLNGWNKTKKKGASKIDIIPIEFINSIEIKELNDYKIFLPNNLPLQFTNKDLKECAKINLRKASICTNILSYLGVIKKIGKKDRSILYEQIKEGCAN